MQTLPNRQHTLNKLPTDLQSRNFDNKHRLSIQAEAKRACIVYIFQLNFHFAYHHWWLGGAVYPPHFLKQGKQKKCTKKRMQAILPYQ